jgi:elongation factor Ts
MTLTISAADVKVLRDRTGAAMMACKNALVESNGDMDQAVELLRVRGESQAAKREGAVVSEGTVQSYIHSNAKVGVLVEVNCETDFVALTEPFVAFAKDLAMHIAAAAPIAVAAHDVPDEEVERERRIAVEQAADKPENKREQIVDGKVGKWLDEVVLLRQKHVNPKYEGRTIEELRANLAFETGENIVIRRFTRFAVGS